jgi:hypothetical protein
MTAYAGMTDGQRRREKGSGWAWAALVGALVVWFAASLTWGFAFIASPVTAVLSGVAWFRSKHDVVFWIGVGANALLLFGLASILGAGG